MQHTLKPYLINAFYTWCMDLGYTPLFSVTKWHSNVLPNHLLNDPSITFNIHPNAIRNLVFGKDKVEFEALFNTYTFQIIIDYKSITSIYNKEEQSGLDFEMIIEEQSTEQNSNKKSHLTLVHTNK